MSADVGGALVWRALERGDGTPVHVILERPERMERMERMEDSAGWTCRWRIETTDGDGAHSMLTSGADSMQAVLLAMKMAGATLACSEATYLFRGSADLGFP